MTLESRALAPAKCYALVLIDLSVGFADPDKSPLGAECSEVMAANARLLELFRRRQWPVFYTTVAYSDPSQAAVFREKLPALEVLAVGSGLEEIDPRVKPQDGEPVLLKHWPSGFFKTDLHDLLQKKGVDGLIVTGLTTSGCVRATAVDGLQLDYRVIVPEEAAGDRDQAAHDANLRDLSIKYVDVLPMDDVMKLLESR